LFFTKSKIFTELSALCRIFKDFQDILIYRKNKVSNLCFI
jgi:hypothetical protein